MATTMTLTTDQKLAILSRFHYENIGDDQARAISAVVNDGRDVFVSTPTGSGKSLVYQSLPDAFSDFSRSVLVIIPIKSIGQEQVKFLQSVGLSAVRLTQDTDLDKRIISGKLTPNFIFCDAETILERREWRDMIQRRTFLAICVDEAHVVKHW